MVTTGGRQREGKPGRDPTRVSCSGPWERIEGGVGRGWEGLGGCVEKCGEAARAIQGCPPVF